MLPDRAARSALVCAYNGSNMESNAGLPLSSRKNLKGDLAAMVDELCWLPPEVPGGQHACTLMGGPQTNFLVAVTFADGRTSWLGTADDPNGCVGTLGSISSPWTTGHRFTAAMKIGRWTPPTPSSNGNCSGGARFGQQNRMVPDGAVGLTICWNAGNKNFEVQVARGFADLVIAFNAPAVIASTSSCQNTPASTGASEISDSTVYRLIFRYPSGPAVEVHVNRFCEPAIDNFSLAAAYSGNGLPLLKAFLPK